MSCWRPYCAVGIHIVLLASILCCWRPYSADGVHIVLLASLLMLVYYFWHPCCYGHVGSLHKGCLRPSSHHESSAWHTVLRDISRTSSLSCLNVMDPHSATVKKTISRYCPFRRRGQHTTSNERQLHYRYNDVISCDIFNLHTAFSESNGTG
jgi:hypothetical protein